MFVWFRGTVATPVLLAAIAIFGTAPVSAAPALPPLFQLLATFGTSPSDGLGPTGIVMSGNQVWGMTIGGGLYGEGIVFRIGSNGVRQTIYNFPATFGGVFGPPVIGPDGNVWATTETGLFSIDVNTGRYKSVPFAEPPFPIAAGPGLASDGVQTLFGTAQAANLTTPDCGAVYGYNVSTGAVRTLATFPWGNAGSCPDGQLSLGTLVYSGGTLYGTSVSPMYDNRVGSVFSVDADGSNFRIVRAFNGYGGTSIPGALVVSGNRIYGTMDGLPIPFPMSPTAIRPLLFSMNTDGSNFVVLYRFPLKPYAPPSALVLTEDGRLCGNAGNELYGPRGYVFCFTPSSGLTVLHSFLGSPDGSGPVNLVESSPGVLIGSTFEGGGGACSFDGNPQGCGTVFLTTVQNSPPRAGSIRRR